MHAGLTHESWLIIAMIIANQTCYKSLSLLSKNKGREPFTCQREGEGEGGTAIFSAISSNLSSCGGPTSGPCGAGQSRPFRVDICNCCCCQLFYSIALTTVLSLSFYLPHYLSLSLSLSWLMILIQAKIKVRISIEVVKENKKYVVAVFVAAVVVVAVVSVGVGVFCRVVFFMLSQGKKK